MFRIRLRTYRRAKSALALSASFVTTLLATACGDDAELVQGPVSLSANPTRLTANDAISTNGKNTEICFVVVESLAGRTSAGTVSLADGRRVGFGVQLIGSSGGRFPLTPDGRQYLSVRDQKACIIGHPPPAADSQYVAVELTADSPITVQDLQWFNGTRRKLLP